MSRRIAIACAALLSTAVIASGSAGAQPAPADAGVAQQPDVVLNEVGVGLTSTGSFVELKSLTSDVEPLESLQLLGCNASSAFQIVDFGTSDVIDPAISPFYLIADTDYTGPVNPDAAFDPGAQGLLNQDDGGVFLLDTSVSPIEVVDGVQWGDPHSTCSSLPDAGVSPDDSHSIRPVAEHSIQALWCRATPTPGGQNGPCVL